MSEYTQYIGIPFKYGGRDRNALDCYGLVMLLYAELKGIELPDINSPTYLDKIHSLMEVEKLKWEPCEIEEGAVLMFRVKGYGCHVGYYIGDDKMIHTWEGTGGVTIERLSFSWKHRILGSYKWNPQNS